jgi:hypothetical protein
MGSLECVLLELQLQPLVNGSGGSTARIRWIGRERQDFFSNCVSIQRIGKDHFSFKWCCNCHDASNWWINGPDRSDRREVRWGFLGAEEHPDAVSKKQRCCCIREIRSIRMMSS